MSGKRKRKRRPGPRAPELSEDQILAWAEAHQDRTGRWPGKDSGPIVGASGETWTGVDQALRVGARRLRGGSSLAQLLEAKRGVRNIQHLPPFTVRQILAWADAHHRRTGVWPGRGSGLVFEAPQETWQK